MKTYSDNCVLLQEVCGYLRLGLKSRTARRNTKRALRMLLKFLVISMCLYSKVVRDA
jgi:hypothetical protein